MRGKSLTSKHLCHSLLLAAVAMVLYSCAKDDFDFITPEATAGLTLTPQVYGNVATRTPSDLYDDTSGWQEGDEKPGDDALKENDLGTTLDVFISGKDDAFWKEFHLTQGEVFAGGMTANVKDNVADLLSDAWKTMDGGSGQRLTVGHTYDVYVAVNTTATNGTVGSKAALLALANKNTIVHKLYGADNNSEYDPSRRMMMDGHVEWKLENDDQLQRIYVPLKRAEAKIAIAIKIDPAFYASLIDNNHTDEPIGSPGWKYVNWCNDAKVFADGNDIEPVLVTNDGRNNPTAQGVLDGQEYYHYQSADNTVNVYFTANEKDTDGTRYIEKYPDAERLTVDGVPTCNIITYDYCSSWADNLEEKAPYLLVSYPFYHKDFDDPGAQTVRTYNYYRIPVCDEAKHTELLRNHIYKVDAIISGSGSTTLSGREKDVRLNYQVVDWTQDENEIVNVKAEKFYYFYVTPKTYELRGEGTQSVDLAYYAPANSTVQIKNQDIYYYDKNGTKKTATATITVNADNGTITVASEVLANRAVKYISFTAYTTYVDDSNVSHTLEEQVFVKHFPTDNIQSIDGWYSTKTRTNTMTAQTVVYSQTSPGNGWTRGTQEDVDQKDKPEGDGWFSNDYESNSRNYDYTTGTGRNTKYYKYRWSRIPWSKEEEKTFTFVDWQETPSGYVIGRDDCMQTKVYENGRIFFIVDGNISSSLYSSPINAIDKITRDQNRYANYKIDGYWYYHQYKRINQTTTRYGLYPNPYSNSNYALNAAGWDYYGTNLSNPDYYEEGTLDYFGYLSTKSTSLSVYTNNHMYIVQISSTSDSFILGRPVIDEITKMSDDHVVSPAFMIASQLGAMSPVGGMTAEKAAQHCSEYIEVSTDGTRYSGWRLPTKEEVAVILDYQYTQSETMAEVLAAKYYYTLDGTPAENTYEDRTGTDGTFARCIRDLTPAEVNAINSKQ